MKGTTQRGMHSGKDRKMRGRTSITGQKGLTSRPHVEVTRKSEADRPQGPGTGKHRGDRRDMSKTYSDTSRHASRGNNPRPDVKTRKR